MHVRWQQVEECLQGPDCQPQSAHRWCRSARADQNSQLLAHCIPQHCSLRDFGLLPGTDRGLYRTSRCQVGELLMIGSFSLPLMGAIGEREGVGQIDLTLDGEIS